MRISDLSSVDISWKMLTLDRPDQKVDREIFSRWVVEVEPPCRLVQLDKLRMATRKEEALALARKGGVDPNIIGLLFHYQLPQQYV